MNNKNQFEQAYERALEDVALRRDRLVNLGVISSSDPICEFLDVGEIDLANQSIEYVIINNDIKDEVLSSLGVIYRKAQEDMEKYWE